jgi:hypothetical protein
MSIEFYFKFQQFIALYSLLVGTRRTLFEARIPRSTTDGAPVS